METHQNNSNHYPGEVSRAAEMLMEAMDLRPVISEPSSVTVEEPRGKVHWILRVPQPPRPRVIASSVQIN